MSEERNSDPVERLQQAFDAVAGGLDLRLEPPGNDPRCIGVAFLAAASIAYDTDGSSPALTPQDYEAIARLVLGHESLTPRQYRDGSWTGHLIPRHVVVAKEGLIETDQKVIETWLDSPRFTDFQNEFPWQDPRQVRIDDLVITPLGPQLAAAAYQVTETLANGSMIAGNAVTVLARLTVGWRAVVITKGGRKKV